MRPYRREWGTLSEWLRHALVVELDLLVLVLDLESPFRAADSPAPWLRMLPIWAGALVVNDLRRPAG
jgi:hypothetical protein